VLIQVWWPKCKFSSSHHPSLYVFLSFYCNVHYNDFIILNNFTLCRGKVWIELWNRMHRRRWQYTTMIHSWHLHKWRTISCCWLVVLQCCHQQLMVPVVVQYWHHQFIVLLVPWSLTIRCLWQLHSMRKVQLLVVTLQQDDSSKKSDTRYFIGYYNRCWNTNELTLQEVHKSLCGLINSHMGVLEQRVATLKSASANKKSAKKLPDDMPTKGIRLSASTA